MILRLFERLRGVGAKHSRKLRGRAWISSSNYPIGPIDRARRMTWRNPVMLFKSAAIARI